MDYDHTISEERNEFNGDVKSYFREKRMKLKRRMGVRYHLVPISRCSNDWFSCSKCHGICIQERFDKLLSGYCCPRVPFHFHDV